MTSRSTHKDSISESAVLYYRFLDAIRFAAYSFASFLDRFGLKVILSLLFLAVLSVPYLLMGKAKYHIQVHDFIVNVGLDAGEARAAFWSDYFASLLSYDALSALTMQFFSFLHLAFQLAVFGFLATTAIYAFFGNPLQRSCASGSAGAVAKSDPNATTELEEQKPSRMFGIPLNRFPVLVLMVLVPFLLMPPGAAIYAMLLGGFLGFLLLHKEDGIVGLLCDRFMRWISSKYRQQAEKES